MIGDEFTDTATDFVGKQYQHLTTRVSVDFIVSVSFNLGFVPDLILLPSLVDGRNELVHF